MEETDFRRAQGLRAPPGAPGELVTEPERVFDLVVVDALPQFSEQVLAALDVSDLQVLLFH